MIQKVINFLKKDVWRISLKNKPKHKMLLIKYLRILLLAFRGYEEDKVSLRSSALTFYSLLSIVPVAAMVFGISKIFGIDKNLMTYLNEQFAGQQEVLDRIIEFSNSLLENTKGGIIAGVGAIVLIWSVMKVFANIESSFNAIWQIRKGRNWFRKFSDYISMLLIAPILLVSSSTATAIITTQIENLTTNIAFFSMIGPVIFFFVKLIPYVLIWLLLTMIFIVMPNTKVDFKSAFIAGIISGTVFVFIQWVYIHFQVGVSKYNTIYGSFAALPLFLIWLQMSWLIVLFGAEVSFAVQNVEKYEFEPDTHNLSSYSWKVLTLMIAHLLIKNFANSEKAMTAEEISKKLEIPIRSVRDIIYNLVDSNILSEINTQHEKEKAYQPAQDINNLSTNYVLNAIDHNGTDKILAIASSEKDQIIKILNDFDIAIQNSNGAILLKDIN
ncbi:MAG: YihY/virulence factor BrkB family protein [Bacteroidales bacterium]|jgi:membrane protein|nr:YihY/virulence factor BrkB family protein [Bacteroidales bacterium]